MGESLKNEAQLATTVRELPEALRALLRKIRVGEERSVSAALRVAAYEGQAEAVGMLLPHCQDFEEASRALINAAAQGKIDCVKLLMPALAELAGGPGTLLANAAARALQQAAGFGSESCVQALATWCDPSANTSMALQWAAEEGHFECVRFLMPVSRPQDMESMALRLASKKGHAKCVELLLPASQPSARNFEALETAIKDRLLDCAKLLLPFVDSQEEALRLLAVAIDARNGYCARELAGKLDLGVFVENAPSLERRARQARHPKLAEEIASWSEQRMLEAHLSVAAPAGNRASRL